MITTDSAKKICSAWYGGQWSALYQFASSGVYVIENHLRYLREIEDCLHPEYALYPGTLSKKNYTELTRAKNYFIQMGKQNRINTEYHPHPVYGYLIPYMSQDTPASLFEKVKQLSYPI